MLKNTIAANDKNTVLSEYNYEIHFMNRELESDTVTGYSYSTVFNKISELYENDEREVSQIVIDFIR